jgi:hypothetical protein
MAVKVDGVEITEQEIQAEIEALRPEYVEYVRQQGGEPSDEQVRGGRWENLIEGLLLRHEAIKTPARAATRSGCAKSWSRPITRLFPRRSGRNRRASICSSAGWCGRSARP